MEKVDDLFMASEDKNTAPVSQPTDSPKQDLEKASIEIKPVETKITETKPLESRFSDYKTESRAKIKSSIQDFLEDESRSLPTETAGVNYDLVEEYAATKSNGLKNTIPVLLWMLAAFAFVGIMAGAIVSIVNKQNSKIQVEVESFDNLNLSNLLDLVSSTQNQINEESANKANLENQRKNIKEQAEAEKTSSLATLKSMNIKDANERAKRQNEIQAAYEKALEAIPALDEKIAESEQKIALYQQQLAQYDTTTVQQAQEHQAEMDSEKQLHQLEKQQMTKEYEGKISDLQENLENFQQTALEKQEEMVNYVIGQYDPTFSEDKTALALVTKVATSYSNYYIGSQERVDLNASENFRAALEKQKSLYNEMAVIGSKFLRIPQKNAIPTFASTMQKIANSAGNELAAASVSEINTLLNRTYELNDKNEELENEKSQMSTQIEGLEGEKQDLIAKNGALTEEKQTLEANNEALTGEKETLAAENQQLTGANDELTTAKAHLETEKLSLLEKIELAVKEKEALALEKESMTQAWETEKTALTENWVAEKSRMEDSWSAEKSALMEERDKAVATVSSNAENLDKLTGENESLALANTELTIESEKLKSDYKNLESQKNELDEKNRTLMDENKSLSTERDLLTQSNKNLSAQNAQYSDLLQSFCVRDGTKIHGFVSGLTNSRRAMLYVENSAYKTYGSKVAPGVLIPVSVVRNGKIIAAGKLTVDSGVAYMIKGSEEDQIMVESLLNLDGANDYTKISVGDEIQISDPL